MAQFEVKLDDKASAPAKAAAESVNRLAGTVIGLGAKLAAANEEVAATGAKLSGASGDIARAGDSVRELEAQMSLMKSSAKGAFSPEEISQVAGAITEAKGSLSALQLAFVETGGTADESMSLARGGVDSLVSAQERAASAAESTASKQAEAARQLAQQQAKLSAQLAKDSQDPNVNFRALSAGLGKLGGPLGEAGSKMAGFGGALKKTMTSLGAAGPFIALAVVVVALTTAFIAGSVAVLKYGIGLADTARSAQLAAQGLAASSPALKNIATIMPEIQAKTGVATAELSKMAEELTKAGIPAKRMDQALTQLATATAGGATPEFVAKLNAQLASGAPLSKNMADAMVKFGDIAQQKMLSLDAQMDRLHNNISGKDGLFSGLDIDPFLKGLQKIVGLFDKNTASGKALKVLFEGIFQPLLNGAVKAIPVIEILFLKAIVYALKAYIAFKSLGKALDISGESVGFYLLLTVLGLVIGTVVALGIAIALVGASIAISIGVMLLPFIIMGAVIYAIVMGVIGFVQRLISVFSAVGSAISGAFSRIKAWFKSLNLGSLGSDIMSGLAKGISSAGGAVLDALTGVVSGAVKSVKSLLGISSPSKVMMGFGLHTSGGLAEGIEGGTADVHAAARGAGQAAISGTAAGLNGKDGASAPGGKGGVTVNVQPGAVVIQGAGGDIMTLTEDAIAMIFEKMALRSGLVSS